MAHAAVRSVPKIAGMMQSIARMVDALLDAEEAVVHSMEERRAAA